MVRMSDLVRGIVREPKPAAPAPEKPPGGAAAAETPVTVPPALPRTRLAEGAARRPEPAPPPAPAVPAPPPAAAPAPQDRPGESAEALFAELVGFLARVRDLMRSGEPFPWDELERRIVQRARDGVP